MLELLDGGVGWEESVPQEEDKVHEGPELDCSLVAGALGVFTQSEAEVEAQGDQVGDLPSFGIGGEGCCGDDGVDDAEWDGLFSFDRRVLQAVVFEPPVETSIQSSVGLGVERLSWVGETIQEVGCHNWPLCLRNLLFPKSVHSALGVLGMSEPVSIYLQDFNSREGQILESRADQQGGAEIVPLPVESLLARILCSSCSHGFLHSVEITHEISCGGRGQSCHEMLGSR